MNKKSVVTDPKVTDPKKQALSIRPPTLPAQPDPILTKDFGAKQPALPSK